MFDLCSERLMGSDERFVGRNGHRFVEIWDCGKNTAPIHRSGDLKEKEIASWVHEERSASGPVQSGLRVLLSPKPSGKNQPSSGKVPFTRQTYTEISRAWRIPSIFLRAVTQKLSIVTQCSVAPRTSHRTSPNSSPYIPWFSEGTGSTIKEEEEEEEETNIPASKISDEAKCLLVRGDADWTFDYSLLLTHDPATNTTYVLVIGLTAIEIDLVLSYLSYISTSSCSISTHHALLPIILLDLACDETSSLLKIRIKLLSQIQQSTGMDRFNSLKSATMRLGAARETKRSRERKGLDLDAVMLRLTCLNDWVAAQRAFVGIQSRVVKAVGKMLQASASSVEVFDERLFFIQETLLAAEQKCQYLERSISAQVQTIYSLIAQKDNRLNHSATRASCQIASDSRRIAILTRRDSTDMRIIAAVTLIFLPGTFVATVFSTGLFDWGYGDPTPAGSDDADGGGGRMISKYIWVYFMLTGALTAVVLLGWGLFSWVQKRRMVRQFGWDLEEEGDEDEEQGRGQSGKRQDTEKTLVEKEGRDLMLRRWRKRMLEQWMRKRGKSRTQMDEGEIVKMA